jgi:hypothetical protein
MQVQGEKSKKYKKLKLKGGEGIRRLVSPSLPPTKDWYLYPLFEIKSAINLLKYNPVRSNG